MHPLPVSSVLTLACTSVTSMNKSAWKMTRVLGNISTYQIPKRFSNLTSQPVDEGGQKKICLPWIRELLLLWIYVEWHQLCHKKRTNIRADKHSKFSIKDWKIITCFIFKNERGKGSLGNNSRTYLCCSSFLASTKQLANCPTCI